MGKPPDAYVQVWTEVHRADAWCAGRLVQERAEASRNVLAVREGETGGKAMTTETIDDVAAWVRIAATAIGLSAEGITDECVGAGVEERDPDRTVSFQGYSISCTAEPVNGRWFWQLSKTVTVPGVRYYPDGSGEPDSSDVVDVSVHEHAHEAAKALILALVTERIDEAFYAEGEAKAFAEEQS
jgi:hypothetical protein